MDALATVLMVHVLARRTPHCFGNARRVSVRPQCECGSMSTPSGPTQLSVPATWNVTPDTQPHSSSVSEHGAPVVAPLTLKALPPHAQGRPFGRDWQDRKEPPLPASSPAIAQLAGVTGPGACLVATV